jgi:hypothetical protein
MAENLRFNHTGFTLAAYLFRQMLVEQNLDTEQAEYLSIKQFYEWVKEKQQNCFSDTSVIDTLFPDKAELVAAYSLVDSDFELVINIFDNPFSACAQLYCWWPLISCFSRKPITPKILGIELSGKIFFEDGIEVTLPMTLGEQAEPFTVGMVCSLWRAQLVMLQQALRSTNLQQIHDAIDKENPSIVHIPVRVYPEADTGISSEDTAD